MAQYQVPQFIEVEDKIFGPLTLRQFIWLAGGGGLCLIFFTLLPKWLAFPFMAPVIGLSLGLAFFQVNGRPLIVALEHAFSYFTGSKLYLWKQRAAPQGDALKTGLSKASPSTAALVVPKLSHSKLKDLSWSLNIKDRQLEGVRDSKPTGFEI